MADEIDSKDDGEQSPDWVRPEIWEPTRETVVPGFRALVYCDVIKPSKWQLKIMDGDKQLYFVEANAVDDHWFEHYVPIGAIKPGTKFILHAHYFVFPAWSQWASTKELVMPDYSPVITQPAEGAVTPTRRPTIVGRGIRGATIKLYEAYSGVVLYGTTVVDGDGNWQIIPAVELRPGPFTLVVSQTISNSETWSNNVTIMVDTKPLIREPTGGAVTSIRPMFTGQGVPGATVKLYQAYSGVVLYGTAVVNSSGTWQIIPVVDLPKGPMVMVVNQIVANREFWSDNVTIIVDPIPLIETPRNGDSTNKRPTFSGQGITGSTIKLYVANSPGVLYGTAVVDANGNWRIITELDLFGGLMEMIVSQYVANREFWSSIVKIYVDY